MSTPVSRTARISPDRLVGWLDRFADAHGPYDVGPAGDGLAVTATDGARAVLHRPVVAADTQIRTVRALVELAAAPRSVALLIVRKGGFAVGVARGAEIVAHRTGSRYVQGRTAAGGSSQARFMRRRENQATAAYAKARDAIEAVVLPYISELTAVVAAGDRRGLQTVLAERPLRPLEALLRPTMAPVGEPKRAGLDDLLAWARAVSCDVTDPPAGAAG